MVATQQELFELGPEEILVPLRIVSAQGGAHAIRLTHVFRPPTLDDWLAYDRALKLTIRETADDAIFHSQAAEAAARLWQRTILRVEGYKLPPTDDSEWQERIPLEHKQQAVRGLALVELEPGGRDEEIYRLDLETREIHLRAHRNGRWYAGLVHRFRRPTTEDELAYRRILSELYVVRGSGETRVPPRLGALVRLYDRLVLAVEGYSVRGVEFDGRGAAAEFSEMDALHKRVAVEALFGELSTLEADAGCEPGE